MKYYKCSYKPQKRYREEETGHIEYEDRMHSKEMPKIANKEAGKKVASERKKHDPILAVADLG